MFVEHQSNFWNKGTATTIDTRGSTCLRFSFEEGFTDRYRKSAAEKPL